MFIEVKNIKKHFLTEQGATCGVSFSASKGECCYPWSKWFRKNKFVKVYKWYNQA